MSSRGLPSLIGAGAAVLAARGAYRLLVAGGLTVDTGIGRRIRPLGPLTVDIDAPRDLVFDVIAAPYLGRPGRDAAERIQVLERGSDMVVAAHRTPVTGRLVATTVESVRFDRPDLVAFRLLRGPVPQVQERFVLEDRDGATRLRYEGELGTDLWSIGARWGEVVARVWVATVEHSLDGIRTRSEERAAAHRRREARS